MYQTTLSSWALMLAKAIEQKGIDRDSLFAQAGLDPQKLNDPNHRYSSVGMKKLWSLASQQSNDPCIGLKAASYWHPTTLHALGYAWMASASLREALQRTVRYLAIVTTASRLQMDIEGDKVILEFPFQASYIPAVESMDAAMAVLVRLCRTSYGEGFQLQQVDLVRNAPDCQQQFVDFFQARIAFASGRNALVFDVHLLDKELPTANAELVRVNDHIIAEHLAELEKNDVVSQVIRQIIHLLPAGSISERDVAGKLNLSLRSLQRKLATEQTSYKKLLEQTRKELAVQYVRDSRQSINEVTYLLGFSEPANFSRAFRRWTGDSPSQYRAQHAYAG